MALTQIKSEGIKDSEVKNADMADDAVGIAELSATGTASSSTFLRGDNSWQTVTSSDTTYAISCVDGDNSDEEKIRLTAGGSGSGTDDVVLEAGTGLSIARSGDKITFTNTVSDTNTNVLAGGTITGDVIFDNATNAGKDLTWDMSDDSLEFSDNTKAVFGDGGDLKIYHNGTDNYIMPSNGKLIINNGSETLAQFTSNGANELYYDNVKKAETYSDGLKCFNHCRVEGLEGESAVLALYADEADDSDDQFLIVSTGSALQIWGQYDSGWHRYLQVTPNGGVQLYYDVLDNSSPTANLETVSGGAKVTGNLEVTGNVTLGDSDRVWFGEDSDAYIMHDNAHLYFTNMKNNTYVSAANYVNIVSTDTNGSNTETSATFLRNGAVELYYDNVKKFQTVANGCNIVGNSYHIDDEKSIYGTGDDLQIQHTSGHSRITHGGAGNLIVEVTTTDSDLYLRAEDKVIIQPHNGNDGIICNAQDSTDLYYDNTKKLSTGAEGITVFSTSPYVGLAATSYNCYVGAANSADNLANGSGAGNLVLRGQTGISFSGDNGTSTKLKVSGSGGELVGTWTGVGTILQVKDAGLSSDLSTTSTSWTYSGLSEGITPSSSSNKILIYVYTTPYMGGSGEERWSMRLNWKIGSGSWNTALGLNRYWAYRDSSNWKAGGPAMAVMHSPNTTDTVTYEIEVQRESGSDSLWLGRGATDPFSNVIQLMEYAG